MVLPHRAQSFVPKLSGRRGQKAVAVVNLTRLLSIRLCFGQRVGVSLDFLDRNHLAQPSGYIWSVKIGLMRHPPIGEPMDCMAVTTNGRFHRWDCHKHPAKTRTRMAVSSAYKMTGSRIATAWMGIVVRASLNSWASKERNGTLHSLEGPARVVGKDVIQCVGVAMRMTGCDSI